MERILDLSTGSSYIDTGYREVVSVSLCSPAAPKYPVTAFISWTRMDDQIYPER
jgi:hypothetical protein